MEPTWHSLGKLTMESRQRLWTNHLVKALYLLGEKGVLMATAHPGQCCTGHSPPERRQHITWPPSGSRKVAPPDKQSRKKTLCLAERNW